MAEPVVIREAGTPADWDAALRLAHRVFAEELGLKPRQPDGRLADPYVGRSRGLVAWSGGRAVGLITVSIERPFSIDAKLPDLDSWLMPARRPVEVRLLAVEPTRRRGGLMARLSREAFAVGCRIGGDVFVCSAMLDRMALYERLGWAPFGPLLGTPEWPLQGMVLRPERLSRLARRLFEPEVEAAP